MTGFELVTRLFGLLLGLAMAEILSGFARTLRVRARVTSAAAPPATRIGWLVPLLGLLVIIDQTSFWLTFYELHGHVPLDFAALLGVLVVVGGYYLLSAFVFPADPAAWPHLDDYYPKVKRIVIGGLLAVNFASAAYIAALLQQGIPIAVTTGNSNPVAEVAAVLFIPVLIVLFFTRSSPRTARFSPSPSRSCSPRP